MSSIEALPPNDSPLNFGWKLVDGDYQLPWFQGDLWPNSLGITYKCENYDSKYCMLLLLFLFTVASFCCIFVMISAEIDVLIIIKTDMFCLISSLCYLEMIEDSEECDKMFNEVDNAEWDISDDNDFDLRSDSEKE